MENHKIIKREEIENWLIRRIAQILEIDESEIFIEEPVADLGLGSVESVGLTGELEDWLHLSLSPDLLWNYPNIASLSEFLTQQMSENRLKN